VSSHLPAMASPTSSRNPTPGNAPNESPATCSTADCGCPKCHNDLRNMFSGGLWLPEVSKSTHYRAYWVHPDWVNEMKKVYKLGVHTFYRPRAWGDGEDEPTWGDPAETEKEAANEEAQGPVSHSKEWLKSEEGQASLRQSARK